MSPKVKKMYQCPQTDGYFDVRSIGTLTPRLALIWERCLIAANPSSTNLSQEIVEDELLNVFGHKEIELIGHYLSNLLSERGGTDRIEIPKKFIKLGDSKEETLSKAGAVKKQLDNLKTTEGGRTCWMYLFLDSILLDNGRAATENKKAIRYAGESLNFKLRWEKHKSQFRCSLKLDFVFDKKEKFLNKLVTAERKLVVVKKEYPSKAVAENVESILINAFRPQLSNSDSGKPSLDFVASMNPQVDSQVALIILNDFSKCEYEEHVIV
uniref:DUF1837 domain-containing protein n=1 Tax=Rhabditophanes sp. KR3021 TaxID=114890 RepID=A0AC35TR26_9BILA